MQKNLNVPNNWSKILFDTTEISEYTDFYTSHTSTSSIGLQCHCISVLWRYWNSKRGEFQGTNIHTEVSKSFAEDEQELVGNAQPAVKTDIKFTQTFLSKQIQSTKWTKISIAVSLLTSEYWWGETKMVLEAHKT